MSIGFRILSYNIHKGIGGIDRKYRPERISSVVRTYDPDIVLMQEVDEDHKRSLRHQQVRMFAEELGYNYYEFQPNVFLKQGRYGNAILSKHPITDMENINLTIPPKKKRGGLMCTIRFTNNNIEQDLIVVNVHLGLAAYERQKQLRILTAQPQIKTLPNSTPVLIGGDFNDVWTNLCRKIMNRENFFSALKKSRTYPAIYPTRSLDRIFHRGEIELKRAFVGRIALARYASDHLPIIADYEFK